MLWKVRKSKLNGTISVPSSKSHTIRALLIATLAKGESVIKDCLMEGDGKSALDAAICLGAKCNINESELKITGIGNDFSKGTDNLFLGNSGTGTRLFTSAAALGSKQRTFNGDASLQTRPMKPLLSSLKDLGASFSTLIEGQDIPFTIQGPLTGGVTTVSGLTSQFLSSLLLSAPLIKKDTTIYVNDLHEKPYVEITLWWLEKMGVIYTVSDDFSTFTVRGDQQYHPICERITGDFSSATFGAVAAAITGGPIKLDNLDFTDPQGDKGIFPVLETMGVSVTQEGNGAVVQTSDTIKGTTIDLNTMPDALPSFSVLGCIAEGETRIVNVKQARIKETDRIRVMATELSKMGAYIEEREDGLVIRNRKLTGCNVKGHEDHRVVMALALAGMTAEGETIIDTAESAGVTYPGFVESFKSIGADIEEVDK